MLDLFSPDPAPPNKDGCEGAFDVVWLGAPKLKEGVFVPVPDEPAAPVLPNRLPPDAGLLVVPKSD